MLHPTFLRRYALESKKDFTAPMIRWRSWLPITGPRNVRDLANTIKRAVLLGRGPVLGIADLPG